MALQDDHDCAATTLAPFSATPSAPPNKNTLNLRSWASRERNASKISDPDTLSRIGIPSRREIHTNGMPSTGQKSLINKDSRNSSSDRLIIKKLTFGVDSKNGALASTAESIRRKTADRSSASSGIPRTPKTSRERSSRSA